jgi:hypothetical protein
MRPTVKQVSTFSREGVSRLPEDGNRSSFRNIVFSSFWNTGPWTESKKKKQQLTVIHHRQNPLKSGVTNFQIREGNVEEISILAALMIVLLEQNSCNRFHRAASLNIFVFHEKSGFSRQMFNYFYHPDLMNCFVKTRRNLLMFASAHFVSLTLARGSLFAHSHSRQSSYSSKTKTILRDFSPQANYTDRATAACRRS